MGWRRDKKGDQNGPKTIGFYVGAQMKLLQKTNHLTIISVQESSQELYCDTRGVDMSYGCVEELIKLGNK